MLNQNNAVTGAYYASGTSTVNPNAPSFTFASASGNSQLSNEISGVSDIKFTDGSSLSSRLKSIEERLFILVPDAKLLEQHEMLREAYNHYKLMEALLLNHK